MQIQNQDLIWDFYILSLVSVLNLRNLRYTLHITDILVMVVDNSDQAQSLVTGTVKKYTEDDTNRSLAWVIIISYTIDYIKL